MSAVTEWCPICKGPITMITKGIPSIGICDNNHRTDRREVLRSDPSHAAPAPAMEAEPVACSRCSGNGELVTDWDEYLHPPKDAPGDHATTDCPDCDGTGEIAHPQDAESLRGEVERLRISEDVSRASIDTLKRTYNQLFEAMLGEQETRKKAEADRDQWVRDYDAMTQKRDAALARVAKLEAENERIGNLFDDICHFTSPEQRRAYLTGGLAAVNALTPQPDAGLEALVQIALTGSDADLRRYRHRIAAALRSRPVGEVKVKPLVWISIDIDRGDGDFESTGDHEAESQVGFYRVDFDLHDRWHLRLGDEFISDHDCPDAAKAAAQADYAARICAALTEGEA